MIEDGFDIPFVADLALREKQIQQNYRPIISVHKWFARRPGTLFRSLLLAEFVDKPLKEAFFMANNLSGKRIADPFMGGGTPLIEANRMGCDVIGYDINPMAYWIVKQEIEPLDLNAYETAAQLCRQYLENEIGHLYRTRCSICGTDQANVKYFLWVKYLSCVKCGERIDLFPGYLLAGNVRHPKNVFVCPQCGELSQTEDRSNPGLCGFCRSALAVEGPAKKGQCKCNHCGTINRFPRAETGPPNHRLFAIEYYCTNCNHTCKGRFFKKPDQDDLENVDSAVSRWSIEQTRFVPDDVIPSGDETDRLHRWVYHYYREMFNARQLLGLELSARVVASNEDERLKGALATNLSDLLRYQNMLCRYDNISLKSLDIFSIHGFPVGLIQCESNILGTIDPGKGVCVGSGGWANIIEKFFKAKSYCDAPFEVRYRGKKKEIVTICGEWIGDYLNGKDDKQREVMLRCGDAATAEFPPESLDAVFTDPPYFGNVQYAELMDFCYVWLRRLIGQSSHEFAAPSTRRSEELTGNDNMGRGIIHFTDGLSAVFQRMAEALKPGAPLAFTYHHNDIKAYHSVAVAILDAGLTCSASIPCPAEMGGSIHINGTGSSILDTVFVCRSKGKFSSELLPETPAGVATLVNKDIEKLVKGNVKPTSGDIRCITYGHLIRLVIWHLRKSWNNTESTERRIARVTEWLFHFGNWPEIEKHLGGVDKPRRPNLPLFEQGCHQTLRNKYAEVSF
ncbi:MAG: DUF1156 domain-containing protein [Deltaproteobacteria bacterium]|nr:DUF1156 domain-containing protein [Deltaproteobacteria bacterium]